MKKVMILVLAFVLLVSVTSCGEQSISGFKTKLPSFKEAIINTGGSDWRIQIESYEINGDMIYIHGVEGQDVLVSSSNCILISIEY